MISFNAKKTPPKTAISQNASQNRVSLVAAEELFAKFEEFCVIDIRQKGVFAAAHLKGSQNLRDPQSIANAANAALKAGKKVVLVCFAGGKANGKADEVFAAGFCGEIFALLGGFISICPQTYAKFLA